MSKAAFEVPRGTTFRFVPEDLIVKVSKSHPLYDPRSEMPLSQEFIDSIATFGVIEPVIIVKDDEGRAIVVDGRQRVRAACEVNKAIKRSGGTPMLVQCVLRTGDDLGLMSAAVTTNECRVDDALPVKLEKLQRYLSFGHSESDAALAFGVTPQTIKNWLEIIASGKDVTDAVKAGKINGSAARTLARVPADKRAAVLDAATKTGKKVTAKRVRQAALKENTPAPKAIERSAVAIRTEIEHCNNKRLDDPVLDNILNGYIAALRWVLGATVDFDELMLVHLSKK